MRRSLSGLICGVNNRDKHTDKSSDWVRALRDARRELFAVRMRQNQLVRAIKIIRKKIASGEPWPGSI